MTIKNPLHKFIPGLIATIVAVLLLAGCSAEDSIRGGGTARGLSLRVPALPSFEGNGTGTPTELTCSSLVFFAFPVSGGVPYVKRLALDDPELTLADTYRQYPIDLGAGEYRFYLVANCFASDSEVPAEEDLLKEAILEYDPDDDFTAIPEEGLPMSADHGDFFIKDAAGMRHDVGSSFVYDGSDLTLYTVLTYACSKVTLDSRDLEENPAAISELVIDKISAQVPVIANENYGSFGTVGPIGFADSDSPFTFYVPERLVEDAAEQGTLTLKIGEQELSLPLGETGSESEEEVNPLPGAGEARNMKRGTHYTYHLHPLARPTLEIEPWTVNRVVYDLLGPVYLEVEQQEYEIVAGRRTKIWFDSDVEDVYVESPKYEFADGSLLDLYRYSVNATSDTISVWVNEEIPSSEYDRINADEERYKHFHIVAGPIHKRIGVSPLTLLPYLYVEPAAISVNVGERIASGQYSGEVPFTIRSNYENVTIQRGEGWALLPSDEWSPANQELLELTDIEGNHLEEGLLDLDDNKMELQLQFRKLNAGKNLWKKQRTLTYIVTGSDSDGHSEQLEVTVTIIPYLVDYKIHFHSAGWKTPHIYIYQCLEFPGNWNQTFQGENLASKPIGYRVSTFYLAALEYSFTGKVAFKGWDSGINHDALYQEDGTMKPFEGQKAYGFYIFDDQTSWNVDLSNTSSYARYDYAMDFCAAHRSQIGAYCPRCDSEDYNVVFPGIQMMKEDEDWWVFQLTGVATPGKALIMFANEHVPLEVTNQFPQSENKAEAAVGIPLFEYPSHEGWLDYNGISTDRLNNAFSASKPVGFRLYWEKSSGLKSPWMWVDGNHTFTDGDFVNSIFTGEEGDYYYYTFFENELYDTSEPIQAILFTTGGAQYQYNRYLNSPGWKLSTFTKSRNGYRCAYVQNPTSTAATLEPGLPPSLR